MLKLFEKSASKLENYLFCGIYSAPSLGNNIFPKGIMILQRRSLELAISFSKI
jgi:hypothetical protein